MKEKDRFLSVEMFITACLVCSAAFLVERQVSFYFPLLIIGLACGLSFSWLTRNKAVTWLNSAIGVSAVIILSWLVFSVYTSSFVYRGVVALCLKGMIALIIVLSFNAASPRVLSDIQALSLPLFMGHAVWLRQYSGEAAFAVLAYLVFGAFVLKVKFRGSFKNVSPELFQGNRSFLILISFFLCSISGAWMIASNCKKTDLSGGVLRVAGAGGYSPAEEMDKQNYELQDKLQERMQRLILRSGSGGGSPAVFSALSVLLNKESAVLDLDRAEQSLADFIRGSGYIKGDELVTLESSLDRKIAYNSGKIRDDINNSLRKSPFNIKDRMKILNRLDRFDSRDPSPAFFDLEGDIQDVIQSSSFASGLKKEISELASSLKDWKSLALYREKNKSLKGRVELLKKGLKEEIAKLLWQVGKAREPADVREIAAEIERLKKGLSGDTRDIVNGIKESLDLKAGMIISEGFRESGEKLKALGLSEDDQRIVQKGIDNLKKTRDHRDFLKKYEELERVLEDNDLRSDGLIGKSVEALRENFIRKIKNRIAQALEGSGLPDNGEKIMSLVRGMESSGTAQGLDNSAGKAKGLVDDAKSKGFITEETGGDIKGGIDGITGLMKEQKDVSAQGGQDVSEPESAIRAQTDSIGSSLEQSGLADSGEDIMNLVRYMASAGSEQDLNDAADEAEVREGDAENGTLSDDYQQSMLSAIKGSDLGEDEQKALSRLTEGLFKAQTIAQMEKSNEGVKEQVRSLRQGVSEKDWPDKFAAEFQEIKDMLKMIKIGERNVRLRNTLEQLKSIDPDNAEGFAEQMDKIVKSKTAEEADEEIKKLEQSLKNNPGFLFNKSFKKNEPSPGLRIDLLPRRVVMPKGGYIFLRPVAVYDGVDIRDISAEVEWVSREPVIARVDKRGAVTALAPGDTMVFCRFKGVESQKARIKVIAAIGEDVYKTLKRELEK